MKKIAPKYFEIAARELETGVSEGTWYKAFSQTGGNDNLARAKYMELRALQLQEDADPWTERRTQTMFLRWLARLLDGLLVFALLFSIVSFLAVHLWENDTVLDLTFVKGSKWNHFLQFVAFQALFTGAFILYDTFLIALFGTTVGKFMIRTRILDEKGKIPTFEHSLSRAISYSKWSLGYILFPLGWLVGCMYQWKNIQSGGPLPWDKTLVKQHPDDDEALATEVIQTFPQTRTTSVFRQAIPALLIAGIIGLGVFFKDDIRWVAGQTYETLNWSSLVPEQAIDLAVSHRAYQERQPTQIEGYWWEFVDTQFRWGIPENHYLVGLRNDDKGYYYEVYLTKKRGYAINTQSDEKILRRWGLTTSEKKTE
jgi:uncharacterized RDD family membrane protein YckC